MSQNHPPTTADGDPTCYEIRSVHDFARIPEDRRAICLKEFEVWLKLFEAAQHLMQRDLIRLQLPEAFVWIDDDKHELTMNISREGQAIHTATGVMRGFSEESSDAR